MRRVWLSVLAGSLTLVCALRLLHAAPDPNLRPGPKEEPKSEKVAPFKAIEINNELSQNDPNDPKLNQPSKSYTLKLNKDKTYIIDLASKDFDAYLRLLDKNGGTLAEDDDGGGNLDSQIVHTSATGGEHAVIVTTFDGQVGKFTLKVRELNLKGEAKTRSVGKEPLIIKGNVGENDKSELGKLGKTFSVQLKAGQSYVFDAADTDFISHLRLFDGNSKLLGQDPSLLVVTPTATGTHHVLLTSSEGEAGTFSLKMRELHLKGEAKACPIGKDGLTINGEVGEKDQSPLGKPGKVYSVQLKADQAYVLDSDSQDFDCQVYLFDGKSKLLTQDLTKAITTPATTGTHQIVVASFDGALGKFNLKVREFSIKAEAKPREVGKNGLKITAKIGNNDQNDIGKLGKMYSVQLKAGHAYIINLESQDLDSYLYVFDGKNRLLAQDDDSGGNLNSRVVLRPEQDGVFHILSTSLDGTETGEITLKVREK